MGKSDFAVFVGRFQPVHRAHLHVMSEALKVADRLIVAVGSHRSPRTLRNPWTYEERVGMVEEAALGSVDLSRVDFVPLRDFLYSNTHWAVGLQNAVRSVARRGSVTLVGHFKDDSSRYLRWFPQWDLVPTTGVSGINARDIRDDYFGDWETPWYLRHADKLEQTTIDYMNSFADGEEYEKLRREADFLRGYRARWATAPFPPTFVTTDVVVVKCGHVLLVRRGMNPGKGMLALPGGFVKQDLSIIDSAMEELKEETNIVYPRALIKDSVRTIHVFDHPERDRRGRTITHAFLMRLPDEGPLPEVEGGDDAAEAIWMPLADLPLHEEQFYSDHFHIIEFFVHQEVSK